MRPWQISAPRLSNTATSGVIGAWACFTSTCCGSRTRRQLVIIGVKILADGLRRCCLVGKHQEKLRFPLVPRGDPPDGWSISGSKLGHPCGGIPTQRPFPRPRQGGSAIYHQDHERIVARILAGSTGRRKRAAPRVRNGQSRDAGLGRGRTGIFLVATFPLSSELSTQVRSYDCSTKRGTHGKWAPCHTG
jgi:hypothetical protein